MSVHANLWMLPLVSRTRLFGLAIGGPVVDPVGLAPHLDEHVPDVPPDDLAGLGALAPDQADRVRLDAKVLSAPGDGHIILVSAKHV